MPTIKQFVCFNPFNQDDFTPAEPIAAAARIGYKSVEKPVPWHDFHATVLHLLGIDHERLSYYHNGIQRRLTNVHGELLKGILA